MRFDRQHAYGDKEKEFKELCERVGAAGGGGRSDFVLAYAGVTEYGDKFAHSIAERFGVSKKETWPAYLYFNKARARARRARGSRDARDLKRARARGEQGNGTKPAARYRGEVQVDKLSAWLTDVADIYIGLAGTLKVFDALARRFADGDDGAKTAALAEAEAALAAIDGADADQTAKATVYVKAMRKLVTAGAAYVDEEVGRINK